MNNRVLAVFLIAVALLLLVEPALAGPGGKIASAVFDTFWGRLLLAILTIIFLLPLSVAVAPLVAEGAGWLILIGPIWFLTIFCLLRATWIGAHYMRVCGSRMVLVMRYDAPIWRRKLFFAEALRRTGIRLPGV